MCHGWDNRVLFLDNQGVVVRSLHIAQPGKQSLDTSLEVLWNASEQKITREKNLVSWTKTYSIQGQTNIEWTRHPFLPFLPVYSSTGNSPSYKMG